MQVGRCCRCGERNIIRWVTIKGLDIADGATLWEYGPGSGWAHHYGLDEITGVEPVITDPWVPDRYVIRTQGNGTSSEIGNRNTATLVANAEQAIKITKLNSLDGSVISSVLLDGGFTVAIDDLGDHTTLQNLRFVSSLGQTAGLSDGMWATIGSLNPSIELLDFTSNGATKEYVFHAHTNSEGTITFTTRGGATLTLAYNASAATVETAIEALTGVTSATCTGGPWPWRKIEVEVVWASSTNDFASIAHSGSGTSSVYSAVLSDVGAPGVTRRLTVTPTVVGLGSVWSFSFTGGATFTYTALTTSVSGFLTALNTAFGTFKTAQGSDGWWQFVNTTASGTDIRFDYPFPKDPLSLSVTGGAGGRSVEGAVTVFDPATGLIENSIGYHFGFPDGASTWLISQTATAPTYTGQDIQQPSTITAAENEKIVAAGLRGGQSWVQTWTTGSTWTLDYTYNTPGNGIRKLCEDGVVMLNFPRGTFTDGSSKTRCGAALVVTGGAVTEIDNDQKSLTTANFDNVKGELILQDDTPANHLITGLSRTIRTSGFAWDYNLLGVRTAWSSNTKKALHTGSIGWNADTIFGTASSELKVATNRNDFLIQRTIAGQPIAFSGARAYVYEFYTRGGGEFNDTAQFRFKFQANSFPPLTTSWLDWDATNADIKAALIAIFGENTEGVVSNIIVNAFGDPPALTHPTSLLERNMSIQFATQTAASLGFGFIPPQYLTRPLANVILETQNTAEPFSGQIIAFNTSDGEELWSREFGTKPDASVGQAYAGWLQGDLLYLYGEQVENDLP
jgi:hypothetical protein